MSQVVVPASEQCAAARLVLGIPVDFVGYDDVIRSIERWKRERTQHYICMSNPHSMMLCRRDTQMRHATMNASMVLPDGIGTVAAAALLGCGTRGRVTGPTLLLRLCDEGRQFGCRTDRRSLHISADGRPRARRHFNN